MFNLFKKILVLGFLSTLFVNISFAESEEADAEVAEESAGKDAPAVIPEASEDAEPVGVVPESTEGGEEPVVDSADGSENEDFGDAE